MAEILVDSNVLLDVLTEEPKWFKWSATMLGLHAEQSILVINPIVYAEVSIGFDSIEELESALPPKVFRRDELPWEAGFLAGKCFLAYRRQGGRRNAPLPDFFIGAHAAVRGMTVLTREARRYKTYFPKLDLIAPKH